jgi:photosystem II stability/assembly factor-like uncharacterized protein
VQGLRSENFNCIEYTYLPSFTAVGQKGIIYSVTNPPITVSREISGTTNNLMSVSGNRPYYNPLMINRFAVGSNGTLIKSTRTLPGNWGPWNPINSGTTQNLNSIDFFPDSYSGQNSFSYGCIVGDNGIILRTTNWGDNWSIINTGITNKLNYVHFTDTMTCWITGSNGLLMKSTNRGLNWITIPTGSNIDIKSFVLSSTYFLEVLYTTYIICGNGGVILQSTNFGISWINILSPTQNNLNSISYSTIIVGNSGTILHRETDSTYLNFRILQGNNIKSFFQNTGLFDQDTRTPNTPGFEWPKGSNKYAVYTSGLNIAAYYQGQLREAAASYTGEYIPGKCNYEVAQTNDTFKLYSVKRTDNSNTNSDWLNWGLMVPYGAQFVDVNNNGIYDPQIDTPGVRGALQTIFMCYTDGFPLTHNSSEGFGGGTAPLYAEIRLTAWCYSQISYADMQFLKFVIINKGTQPWTRTYFSIVSDPDLGYPIDDYVGCDSIRNLSYCYNATNNDANYGIAPPAVGFVLLKGAYNKYSIPPKQINMNSFVTFYGSSSGAPSCETDPNPDPIGAYHLIQGYKKDSTSWLDPTYNPPKKTRIIYPGDPETNTGWTEYQGSIRNCNHDSTGQVIVPDPPFDMRFVSGSGAENLIVMPGDTQTIVLCQLIAKGTSNLNSVTKLKQLADVAIQFYNSGYTIGINKISSEVPRTFRLEQNYPNPFNPTTKIKFQIPSGVKRQTSDVKLVIYDVLGHEIQTLVNEKLQPGTYEVTFDGSNFASGIYFYQLKSGNFIETKKMLMIK